jgi:hypothetical protein
VNLVAIISGRLANQLTVIVKVVVAVVFAESFPVPVTVKM